MHVNSIQKMGKKNKEKTMKKVALVSLAIAATVTLSGGAFAFATTQFDSFSSNNQYSTLETKKSTSETKKVEKNIKADDAKVAQTETTTSPETATPEVTAPAPVPAPVQAPAPAPAPEVAAPAPAPVEDPMTRQWTDGAGNSYIGPNAVACADGATPIAPDFGLPAMCPIQLF
jgi:cytoskeletal protein RodZ